MSGGRGSSAALVAWPLGVLLVVGCARNHAAPWDAAPSDAGLGDAEADRDADAPVALDDAGEDPACLEPASLAGFDRFLRDVVLARCEHVIACGRASFDWASVEDCARYDADANHYTSWPQLRGSVRDGVFTLDPGRVEACLDEIRACPPSPSDHVRLDSLRFARRFGAAPPACWDAVRLRCPGPRQGERCVVRWSAGCADGLYCEPDECDPTCRAPGGPGAPCFAVEACRDLVGRDYVYCDRPSDLTLPGTCRGADGGPSAGADERCGLVDLGDGPRVVECDPGLACRASPPGEYRCVGASPDGAPCGVGCRAGSFCDAGVCAPRAGAHAPVPVGAPCDTPDGDCERQHRTTCVDGVCTEVGRAAGQRCDPHWFESSTGIRVERCDPGLACDEASSERCVEVRPVGDACSIDVGCESSCCVDGACRPSSECPLPWCE